MKKIAKILFLSASLFCTTACSDFLDQTAPSEQPGENVFESTFFTELAVNKLYGLMTQDAGMVKTVQRMGCYVFNYRKCKSDC